MKKLAVVGIIWGVFAAAPIANGATVQPGEPIALSRSGALAQFGLAGMTDKWCWRRGPTLFFCEGRMETFSEYERSINGVVVEVVSGQTEIGLAAFVGLRGMFKESLLLPGGPETQGAST